MREKFSSTTKMVKKMLPMVVGSISMFLSTSYSEKKDVSNLVILFPITMPVKNSSKRRKTKK